MAENSKRAARKQAKKTKRKQGHKLVWITLIIIAIPFAFVAFVLATSAAGQNQPVEGNRFGSNDLNPSISDEQIETIQSDLSSLSGVQSVEVNLKSATLRITMDVQDDASQKSIRSTANRAYNIVDSTLPITTYFTNTDNGKMYDLEINAYNYLVDDSHPESGQIAVEITKTGEGKKTTDILTKAKDKSLVKNITR